MFRGFRTAEGGWPGGGAGHGGNPHWAAGGGGGYSMVAKKASSNTRGLRLVCGEGTTSSVAHEWSFGGRSAVWGRMSRHPTVAK